MERVGGIGRGSMRRFVLVSRAVDGVSKAAKREEVDVGYSLRDERQRIAFVFVVLFEQSKERTLEARRVKRTRVCNQGKSQTRRVGLSENRVVERRRCLAWLEQR
jgi:hypothetical protein